MTTATRRRAITSQNLLSYAGVAHYVALAAILLVGLALGGCLLRLWQYGTS
jgi:hypothetical protein